MVKKGLGSISVPEEILLAWNATMKGRRLKRAQVIEAHMLQDIRSAGFDIYEQMGQKMIDEGQKIIDEARLNRIQYKMVYSEAMIKELDRALSPVNEYGGKVVHSEKSIELIASRIGQKYHMTPDDIKPCFVERIGMIFDGNEHERDRLISIIQGMQAGDQQ
jgi:hypothetical protein